MEDESILNMLRIYNALALRVPCMWNVNTGIAICINLKGEHTDIVSRNMFFNLLKHGLV